ncbi:portal protein [Pseudomonas phage vB_PpuM-Lauda]
MIRMNNRMRLSDKNGRMTTIASPQSMSGSMGAGGHPMTRAMGGNASTRDSLLDGILKLDPDVMRQIYMDMYLFDPTIGGATDLLAQSPWSDYDLVDAEPDQLDVFYRSMELLNYRELMPEFTIDYLTLGAAVGTPLYSVSEKAFTDIIPHSIASIQVQEVPLYSQDPVLTLLVPEEMRTFATSQDPYVVKMRQRMTPKMVEAFRAQEVALDPVTTLYVPRTSFSTVQQGVSLYTRLIPIYLLERLLYRGTLTEATRRQRSTLHIQAGDDLWNPDDNELNSLVQLFLQAEQDPVSAIVATQMNVQTQEIRAAGDFWKWTDNLEQFNDIKLRGMGINESYMSGDVTYDNLSTSVTMFQEQQDSLREMMVRKTLYTKVFPVLSITHDFRRKEESSHARREMATAKAAQKRTLNDSFAFQVNDKSSLVIPKVVWHKKLRSMYTEGSFDILEKLSEAGLPVTLRAWAAAGGYDLDSAMQAMADDAKLRKQVSDFKAENGIDAGTENDFNLDGDTELSMVRSASALLDKAMGGRGMKPLGLLGREFSEADSEVVRHDHSGKRKWVPDQHRAKREENDKAMKALKQASDPDFRAKTIAAVNRRQGARKTRG